MTREIEAILLRAGNFIHGRDSEDDSDLVYESIVEWKEKSGLASTLPLPSPSNNETRKQWYRTGYNYWEDESNCAPTVNGVLGGFACLSKGDLEGSAEFIQHLKSSIRPELKVTKEDNDGVPTRACECGAGEKNV